MYVAQAVGVCFELCMNCTPTPHTTYTCIVDAHIRSMFEQMFIHSLTHSPVRLFVDSFTFSAYSHTQFNIQRYTLNRSDGKRVLFFSVNIFVIPSIFYMVEFAQFFLIWVLSPASNLSSSELLLTLSLSLSF